MPALPEKGSIYFRRSPFGEAAFADRENLAHAVATVQNAVGIGPGGPHGIAFGYLYDNAVGGQREKVGAEISVAEAFLPHAPQHPLMMELGEVWTYLALVFLNIKVLTFR